MIRVLPHIILSIPNLLHSLGIVGTFIGGTFGLIRSRTPVIFAVVSGLQWFTLASTFWGTSSLIISKYVTYISSNEAVRRTYIDSQISEGAGLRGLRYASAVSGGVAGATSALIFSRLPARAMASNYNS